MYNDFFVLWRYRIKNKFQVLTSDTKELLLKSYNCKNYAPYTLEALTLLQLNDNILVRFNKGDTYAKR